MSGGWGRSIEASKFARHPLDPSTLLRVSGVDVKQRWKREIGWGKGPLMLSVVEV